MIRTVLLLAIGGLVIACHSVSSPTRVGGETPVGEMHVQGQVVDTAFRRLSDARIEVVNGPSAGAAASSDGMGLFQISGNASGGVRLRASLAGFQSQTVDTAWAPASDFVWASFRLEPIESALAIEPGAYSVTVTTDLAKATGHQAPCEGFPADLTTRTFEGTVRVSTSPTHDYEFSAPAAANRTLFRQLTAALWLGVAGQFVGFESDDPIFSEELPGFRYLQILGNAPTSDAVRSTGTSLSVPFYGDFWYCRLTSAMSVNNCSQVPREQLLDYRSCRSVHDTMVFTKR